jgi:hypothetical protein
MSRGLGKIQRECLRVIQASEAAGRKPTTFTVVADVYQLKPDKHGNRMCNDAQHTSVKRTLSGLRRKGLVYGAQNVTVHADGTSTLTYNQMRADGSYNMFRAERCCHWSRAQQVTEPAGMPDSFKAFVSGRSEATLAPQLDP